MIHARPAGILVKEARQFEGTDIMAYLLKTSETRVRRTYKGGATLDQWHGRKGENGSFPEDWLASTTRAFNPGCEYLPDEGLSRVVSLPGMPLLEEVIAENPTRFLGKQHVERFGQQVGFLVKLIDAGERLTIQVHPDRRYAKEVLNSDYGKTEAWYILGSEHDGVEPCVYLGFKPGITREKWKALFEAQDIEAMLSCLHRIPVHAGDSWLISGGVPHAIGDGCFLAEVQEPTDYTMRVELVTPGGIHIDERQCHQGAGYERMLDCFHYEGHTLEETTRRWKAQPRREIDMSGGTVDSLIDERMTNLFSMRVIDAKGALCLPTQGQISVLFALSGVGEISCGNEIMPLRQGEVLVTRANCPELGIRTASSLRLLQSFPPALSG